MGAPASGGTGAAGTTGGGTGAEPPTTGQLAWSLFPLYFTHVQQAVLTSLPFTLAVYMVRDFEKSAGGEAPSEATVGKLTGLLAATFCAAQLVTSYPWGMISDRIGRKPVLVIGNISCVISTLFFGLSGAYWQAVVARAVGGALNAVILAEKAMIGEGVPRASQAKAFGLMSLCWGLGSLAGPMIGGSLSAPCSTALRIEALCGEGSLMVRRPYLLPCLLAALMSAVAAILSVVGLEETLPSRRSSSKAVGGSQCSSSRLSSGTVRYHQVAAAEEGEEARALAPAGASRREVELGGVKPLRLARAESSELLAAGGDSSGAGGWEDGKWDGARRFTGDSARGLGMEEQGQEQHAATANGGGGGKLGSGGNGGRFAAGKQGSLDSAEVELVAEAEAGGDRESEHGALLDLPAGTAGAAAAAAEAVPWHRLRSVRLALLGYGLIAWAFNILDEITPIFASAGVDHGGLGFSPSQLAPSLSFGGTALVFYALFGYPWLSRRLGVVRSLRWGLWHTAPLALLTPCASLFHGALLPSQAVMFVSMGLKAIAGTNAFTSCLILVNELAPPGSLGAVNGAGQSLASLVRAAGPALGGLSWGWSLQLAELTWWPHWLPHQFLPFALVACLAAGTDLVYWDLHMPAPEEVHSSGRRREGDEEA